MPLGTHRAARSGGRLPPTLASPRRYVSLHRNVARLRNIKWPFVCVGKRASRRAAHWTGSRYAVDRVLLRVLVAGVVSGRKQV